MSLFFSRAGEPPIGPLTLVVDADGRLVSCEFDAAPPTGAREDAARCAGAAAQLAEYLAGQRRSFELALAPRGTEFQRRVWDELLRIPYGTTISYRELAVRLGNPAATRAVARANATNPLPVVVPCHRVIGSDGTLTGYGGGLERKRSLLALEGVTPPAQRAMW
jgi:methylated-DNA-[protein]-cysteine S-methyltransferase